MAITYNPGAGWYDVGIAVEDIKAGDHVKYNAQGNMVARLPPTVGAPSRPPLISGFSVEPGEVWTTEPCNNSGCTVCNPITGSPHPITGANSEPDAAPCGPPSSGGSVNLLDQSDPRFDLIHPFE